MIPSDPWGAAPTAVPATDSGADDDDLDTTEPHFAPIAPLEPAPPVVIDAPLPPHVPVVSPGGGIAARLVAVVLAGVLVALVVVWIATQVT